MKNGPSEGAGDTHSHFTYDTPPFRIQHLTAFPLASNAYCEGVHVLGAVVAMVGDRAAVLRRCRVGNGRLLRFRADRRLCSACGAYIRAVRVPRATSARDGAHVGERLDWKVGSALRAHIDTEDVGWV